MNKRSTATALLPSPMALAIEAHLGAHERYRIASTYLNMLPPRCPEWQTADDASSEASEAMIQAFNALGETVPQSPNDLAALAIHLRMVLATSEFFEGEFAPTKEAFSALESACVAFAGRGAP